MIGRYQDLTSSLSCAFSKWQWHVSLYMFLHLIQLTCEGFRAAALAQWICVCPPLCGPGFGSQAQLLRFFQFIFQLRCEKDKIKQKDTGIGPFFLKKKTCEVVYNVLQKIIFLKVGDIPHLNWPNLTVPYFFLSNFAKSLRLSGTRFLQKIFNKIVSRVCVAWAEVTRKANLATLPFHQEGKFSK